MAIDSHTSSEKFLEVILENGPSYDYAGVFRQRLKRKIQETTTTRQRTYLSLNLLLISTASYEKESSVKENQRISFIRLVCQVIAYKLKMVVACVYHLISGCVTVVQSFTSLQQLTLD